MKSVATGRVTTASSSSKLTLAPIPTQKTQQVPNQFLARCHLQASQSCHNHELCLNDKLVERLSSKKCPQKTVKMLILWFWW